MFLFLCPQYLTTEPMSLRYSVIIFHGGTRKSLAHRERVGKAMLYGCYSFRGDYSGLMSPSNGRGLKPSP